MELQEFTIPKYNWDVCAYYYTDGYDVETIISKMTERGAKKVYIEDARENMEKDNLNTGICYSSPSKQTIIVIAKTSSPDEFMSSLAHEQKNLCDAACGSHGDRFLRGAGGKPDGHAGSGDDDEPGEHHRAGHGAGAG